MNFQIPHEESAPKPRFRVLHLASWYPSKIRPIEGIFVKKHVEADALFSDTAVFYVVFSPEIIRGHVIESRIVNGVLTTIVYVRQDRRRTPVVSTLKSLFRYSFGVIDGLSHTIRTFGRPDIVTLDVITRLGFLAILLKLFKGIPYIIIEHSTSYVQYSTDAEYRRNHNRFNRFLTQIILRYSNALIGVSRFLVSRICALYDCPNAVYVVPNVVSVPLVRAECGKIAEPFKFLAIGNFKIDHKGYDLLIQAFALFVGEDNDTELHIVGDGEDKTKIVSLVQSLGVAEKVYFHDPVKNENISELYSNHHVLVVSSRYETFSVVCAEALAHGVPVLTTKCGGPEEFVTEEYGVLVEKGDAAALAEGMKKIKSRWTTYDPKMMQAYAEDKFSDRSVGGLLLDVYRNATARVGT